MANPFSDLSGYRKKRGLNQTTFWQLFGVTQSGGSRYEMGRAIPIPITMLLQAYEDGLLDDTVLQTLRERAIKSVKKAQAGSSKT